MSETTETFERFLESLELRLQEPVQPPDAIDRELARPPRRTSVRALRDDPVVARFREDLSNGLVRLDTVNALLRLMTDFLQVGKTL